MSSGNPNGPTCQVPPAAASVGYNQLTYGGDMALGVNWQPIASGAATQNSDGSITIPGGTANHYNDQLNSGSAMFGGGGYFSADIKFANPPAGYAGSDGWPAFWMTTEQPNNVEVDFFEFMDAGQASISSGLIDWGQGGGGSNSTMMPHFDAGVDTSQYHNYGYLWVPATSSSPGYTKLYIDGKEVAQPGTWNQGDRLFSSMDSLKYPIIFGTGSANPMTVKNAQIWQKDASQDSGVAGTTTGNTGGACPTAITPGSAPSGAISSSSPMGTPLGSQGGSPGGGSGGPQTASSSSGITPQTSLGQTLAMGSPTAGGEWGSFADNNGNTYQAKVIDPPGPGDTYEVLIANNGTPYIFALPGTGGGATPVSSNPAAGAGTVSSQWGNPTPTDMSASGNTTGGASSNPGSSATSGGGTGSLATNSLPGASNSASSSQSGGGKRNGSGATGSGSGAGSGGAANEAGAEDDTQTAGGTSGSTAPEETAAGSASTGSASPSATPSTGRRSRQSTSASSTPSTGGAGASSAPNGGGTGAPQASGTTGSSATPGAITASATPTPTTTTTPASGASAGTPSQQGATAP